VNTKEFKKAYGPLIEGLNLKTTISKYWNQLNMFRWAIVTLILVVSKDFSA
jgi:hypothetical protein